MSAPLRRRRRGVLVALLALGLGACGDDGAAPVPAVPETLDGVMHLVDRPHRLELDSPLASWDLPESRSTTLATKPVSAGGVDGSVGAVPWPLESLDGVELSAGSTPLERIDDLTRWNGSQPGWVFLPRRQVVRAPQIRDEDLRGRRTPTAVAATPGLLLRHGDWFETSFLSLGEPARLRVHALRTGTSRVTLRGRIGEALLPERTLDQDGRFELEVELAEVALGTPRLHLEIADADRTSDEGPRGLPVLLVEAVELVAGPGDRVWIRGGEAGARVTLHARPRAPRVEERILREEHPEGFSIATLGGPVGVEVEGGIDAGVALVRGETAERRFARDGWIVDLAPGLSNFVWQGEASACVVRQPAAHWVHGFEDPEIHRPDDLGPSLDAGLSLAIQRSIGRHDCADDRRLGLLLPPRSVLAAPIPDLPAGTQLRFALGDPGVQGNWPGQRGSVLRVFDEGRLLGEYSATSSTAQWTELRLPLEAGSTRSLRFEVEGVDDGARALLLGDPRLVPAAADPRPNLLVYLTDTLRADQLGCYGAERPTSPSFDRIAKRCYRFANLRSVSSWTRPAIGTLFTGLLPTHHGILTESSALPVECTTLAEVLREQGWSNGASIANIQVSALGVHFEQGFHRFVPPEGSGVPTPKLQIEPSSVAIGRMGERMLDEREGEPFFLYLHSMDPHFPYRPPEDLRGRFSSGYEGPLGDRELVFLTELLLKLHAMAEEGVPLEPHVQHLLDVYDEEILAQDRAWGRLFDELERRGRLEDTIVLFVSDHGEEFDEHGKLTHAGRMWDELLHVPSMLYVPPRLRESLGLREPGVVEQAVSLLDLPATLLDLLGIEPPIPLHGRSLRRLLTAPDRGGAEPGPAVLSREAVDLGAFVRGPRKLLFEPKPMTYRDAEGGVQRVPMPGVGGRPQVLEERVWRLFQLDEDPGETRDLAAERPQDLQEMLAAFAEAEHAVDQAGAPRFNAWFRPSASDLERLRQIGYDPSEEGSSTDEDFVLGSQEQADYFAPTLESGWLEVGGARLVWSLEDEVREDEYFRARRYRLLPTGADPESDGDLALDRFDEFVRLLKAKRSLERALWDQGRLLRPEVQHFVGPGWRSR